MSVSTYTPDSTKILHTAYADFVSRQIGRTIHIVQYDDGLPLLAVKLFSDGQPYTIPSNADINIKLGKSDGTFVYNPTLGCDSARRTVYFEVTYQMAVLAEKVSPVIEVITGSSIAASSSISIIIDRNPIQNSSLESTSEWKAIQEAVDYAKEAVSAAASASASRSASALSESNALSYKNEARTAAANAENSASAALESANNAKNSENNAKTSETNAKVSETNAKVSEDNAKTSETNVMASETNAKVSEDNAKTSETNAKVSEDNAKTSEINAQEQAEAADTYASLSKSYAIGEGDVRLAEKTDNAKYYSEQAAASASSIFGVEERVSADLNEWTEKLTVLQGLAEQVSEDKKLVNINKENTKTYMDNAKSSETNAKVSEDNAKKSETNAKESETNAKASEMNAKESEANAKASETSINRYEKSCAEYAKKAQSYATGDTDYRVGESTDNARYYYQQVKQMSAGLSGGLVPMGTVLFSLLESQTKRSGYMYNISDEFVSDDTFKDGGGITYPSGTNVYYTADGYWDCLSGSSVAGFKGDAETHYKTGLINITCENIGTYTKTEIDNRVDELLNIINAMKDEISNLKDKIKQIEDYHNDITVLSINE